MRPTSSQGERKLKRIGEDLVALEMLINLEKQFCVRPGVLDMGQHLLAVAVTSR
jgi:hypothetical protein